MRREEAMIMLGLNFHSLLSEHDSSEFFKTDLLVAVQICDGDHLLDVLFREIAAEHIGHLLEFAEPERFPILCVEYLECFEQLFLRLRVLKLS